MHHHGGLGLLTPYDVQYRLAAKRHAEREAVLLKAFETMPERFVRGGPKPLPIPAEVWNTGSAISVDNV
jgi:putative transposase